MGEKPNTKGISATPDEFNEPIVVPFRGMPKNPDGTSNQTSLLLPDPPGNDPSNEDLCRDGVSRQIEKLLRLGEHYGIDQSLPNWGLHLALRIAVDHHPGFRIVYDDELARMFYRLHGFTPIFDLKGKPPSRITPGEKGWAALSKLLTPEILSFFGSSKFTDREICEALVKAADPKMAMRKNKRVADSRAATLNRRLTEGRRKKQKQKLPAGKKTDV
ncbi:MAG: hypothetical protein ACLPSW_05475 [Roseiarcus sp.]